MTTTSRRSDSEPTIAVVGCGAITESFYLPALIASPARDKLILIDTDTERTKKMSARFGAKAAMRDHHEALSTVDGVIIAVPHHLHYSISRDFLLQGVHILCEKPLAESAVAARDMIRLAEAHQTTITVNHTRRLMPSSMKVKELLSVGTIGRVKSISYLDGGEFSWPTASGFYFDSKISRKGVLLDIGSHAVDLVCWWLNGKPRLVSSFNDSFGGIEAVASLELEHQGCTCHMRLSRLSKLPNRYRIEGENGVIEGGVYDGRTVCLVSPNGRKKIFRSQAKEDGVLKIASRLINNFLGVIRGDESPLVPAKEVLDTIELIDEAYVKAEQFPMAWYGPREVKYVA